MKKLCLTLAYVELVLGVIGSISLAHTLGYQLNYKTFELERNASQTFVIFISSMLCVITLWAILCAISEVLGNQEVILDKLRTLDVLKHNEISALGSSKTPICSAPEKSYNKTSVPKSTKVESQHPIESKPVNDDWKNYKVWKCPNCKRVNDTSVATCTCGTMKPQ